MTKRDAPFLHTRGQVRIGKEVDVDQPERIQGFGSVRAPNRAEEGFVLILGKPSALEWRNPAYKGIQFGQGRQGLKKAFREFFPTTIDIDLHLQLAASVSPAQLVNFRSLLCHRWPLYFGRVCSGAGATAHMDVNEVEVYFEDRRRVYEETKPWVTRLWNENDHLAQSVSPPPGHPFRTV